MKKLNLNALWLSLYAVGIGLFMIGMPKNVDDFWYMEKVASWFFDQGILYPDGGGSFLKGGFPWQGIVDTWVFRWHNDNIRLCNMVVMVALLLPKWLGSGLVFIAWMYAVLRGFALAGVDWRRSALVPFALFILTFLMPWRDRMGSLVFEFNYIVSCAIAVAVFSGLRRSADVKAGRRGAIAFLIYGFLPGLVLGWWQEGFSVPVLGGLVVLVALSRRWRNGAVYGAMTGIIVSLCILASSPFMRMRFDRASSCPMFSPFHIGVEVAPFMLMATSVVAVTVLSRRARRLWRDETFLFFVVGSVVTVVVSMVARECQRTLTWSVFGSTIVLMMLARTLWPWFWRRYNALNLTAGAVLMSLSVIHLAMVDVYSFRFREIMRKALEDLVENDRKTAFAEGYLFEELPAALGCMPDYRFFIYSTEYLNQFYGDETLMYCRITPEALRYATARTGREIDSVRGIREYNGYYYMPFDNLDLLPDGAEMDHGSGFRPCNYFSGIFYSDADGRKYIWLYVQAGYFKTHFGELKGVRFI